MISPAEIKIKAERKYHAYLQAILEGSPFFPLQITGDKNPGKTVAEFQSQLIPLLNQSKQKKGFGYSIDYKVVQTKTIGTQSLPTSIFFDQEDDYLRYLNKGKEVQQFRNDANLIARHFPELTIWMIQNPLKIIQYQSHWASLIKVCSYFKLNPQPLLYIRELPAGVHTKFIEQFKPILRELLDIIIAPFINNLENEFEKRFFLKSSEPLIRFKVLDPQISNRMFAGLDDLSVPLSQFDALTMPVSRVIIVENKIPLHNTFTLPKMDATIAVFGKGYQVSTLKHIHWLKDTEIWYWGDMDAHGFEILSQVRGYFPQTKSWLMDIATFERFFENDPGSISLVNVSLNLTEEETFLYNKIKLNNWRLEQEKIPLAHVIENFNKI